MTETHTKQTENKFAVADLLVAKSALESLSKLELPFLTAYRVVRLITRLRPEFEAAEKMRISIFERFGTRYGDRIEVAPERMADFHAAYRPFLESIVDLDVKPIPVSMFEHAPNITPEMLQGISLFLEE